MQDQESAEEQHDKSTKENCPRRTDLGRNFPVEQVAATGIADQVSDRDAFFAFEPLPCLFLHGDIPFRVLAIRVERVLKPGCDVPHVMALDMSGAQDALARKPAFPDQVVDFDSSENESECDEQD